jgi:hypothetical protein
MDWASAARQTIQEVHMSLPDGATLAERTAAVDAAYPFGQRAYSPYKTWLRARREYLCRHGYQPKGKPLVESPMERMMRRATPSALPENPPSTETPPSDPVGAKE